LEEGYSEIDFIRKHGEVLPVVVTSSEEVPRGKVRRLSGFMKGYGLKMGVLVVRREERRKEELDGKTVELVPLLNLLFNIKL
jgi:hypothetical protein